MQFIWDPDKNKINIKKHGIDFTDVPEIFDHPMLVSFDDRKNYGEQRWIGLGLLRIMIVVIVFSEPDTDTIRIISARKATRQECKKYEETVKNQI